MLTLNPFSLLSGLLNRRFQNRSDETQLRRELLAHRRRELVHQHIPDVYAAQATFGQRFDELLNLLISYDPGHLRKLAAESPYYPEMARTLLYQLAGADTMEKMRELLRQETSLWFGQRVISADELEALAAALWQWHTR